MTNSRDVLITFSEELNKRMECNGVSYRQVAFAARVTKGSMIHYKSGRCFPELWALVLIADYLKCSVNELLGYPGCFGDEHNYNAAELYPNRDIFMDYFRDRLNRQMQLERISSQQLAIKTSFTIDTIERYLSIHRWVPQVPDLIKICDALDCTPSDLLGY